LTKNAARGKDGLVFRAALEIPSEGHGINQRRRGRFTSGILRNGPFPNMTYLSSSSHHAFLLRIDLPDFYITMRRRGNHEEGVGGGVGGSVVCGVACLAWMGSGNLGRDQRFRE
jgi:hypothetical protein